jgi:hypothetical protein
MYNIYLYVTKGAKIIVVESPAKTVTVLHKTDIELVSKRPHLLKMWVEEYITPYRSLDQFKSVYTLGKVSFIGSPLNLEGIHNLINTMQLLGVLDV